MPPCPAVTRASLQADLLAAHDRAARLYRRASGSWRNACPKPSASRPGASPGSAPPTDIDALNQQVTHLEQQAIDLRLQLAEERDQDLTAARAANRELMAQHQRHGHAHQVTRRTPARLRHTCRTR